MSEAEYRYKIIRNSARCRKCGDEIVSKHVHDFVTCLCGTISVDGGDHYLRRIGYLEDCEDTSITETIPCDIHEGRSCNDCGGYPNQRDCSR